MTRRKSARIAAQEIKAPTLKNGPEEGSDDATEPPSSSRSLSLDCASFASDSDAEPRPPKRRRVTTKSDSLSLLQPVLASAIHHGHALPLHAHAPSYHNPVLLSTPSAQASLLQWFQKEQATRLMPWRKPFLTNPSRADLSRRAYEVWISEIMLQQTRVATVIGYWNKWMVKWPTIEALAQATEEEVVNMWTGLGYYSRARRIHTAAQKVVGDKEMHGLLPDTVEDLMKHIPGVGRYTAGAISAIVFGRAEPMVDGNVMRVLSRQMGLMADVKGDKKVTDVLWEAADSLVKSVAEEEGEKGDKPGLWGQALMELGSTICTPKPQCGKCPITESCKAYAEGLSLARGLKLDTIDIEDGIACVLCEPLVEHAVQVSTKKKRQPQTSKFFETFRATVAGEPDVIGTALTSVELDAIVAHAQRFPLKKPKKQVREEETLVCAIRRVSDGQYLLSRRPDKGLLAGLWEFPSYILPASNDSTSKMRKKQSLKYVASLLGSTARYKGELGTVPWQFSHLRLAMHVHLFELDDADASLQVTLKTTHRWAFSNDIDIESMGTGMKKCWSLIKASG
ncbi:putative A/G-specific adenine DNA glycosylase [Triangularia verruculosa]|uniref:Adenine DNA glycosylase n=1 Tax=Triangularia verruculosa TaxID=2587418 RepID=A0AAN7AUV2_9PEZI|nr:putative A/G-specific adenine DNA glycosylase [Triangularia verruculosa]